MSDLISRTEIISTFTELGKTGRYGGMCEWVIEIVKQLPPAEHGTNLAQLGTDAISRQAAIDALKRVPGVGNRALDKIRELPPITVEQDWIPVSKEMPPLRHDVWLTVFFHEKWNVAEGYRQDGEFMFWNHGRLDSVLDEENRVIAWMPKPEPFKGVTK